jgi:hypothetical protein
MQFYLILSVCIWERFEEKYDIITPIMSVCLSVCLPVCLNGFSTLACLSVCGEHPWLQKNDIFRISFQKHLGILQL